MKKTICMLLLALSGSMIAQTKTVVTQNGEKLTIDNGLSTPSGKLQLGGDLTKNTSITTKNKTLEIKSDGTAAAPVSAIKIVDGAQLDGAVLTSNGSSGDAMWKALPGSWFALLLGGESANIGLVSGSFVPANWKNIGNFSDSYKNGTDGAVDKISGEITVPSTGYYQISVAGHFGGGAYPGSSAYLVNIEVFAGATSIWDPHCGQPLSNWGASLTFNKVFKLNAGDKISVKLCNKYTNQPVSVLNGLSLSLTRL